MLLIYINGLSNEIEKCKQLAVKFSDNKMSDLLFANDLVGLSETGPALQILIGVVYNYSKRWRFEANVKSSVVIFSKGRKFRTSGFGIIKTSMFWIPFATLE